jgi:hypothetical protein
MGGNVMSAEIVPLVCRPKSARGHSGFDELAMDHVDTAPFEYVSGEQQTAQQARNRRPESSIAEDNRSNAKNPC